MQALAMRRELRVESAMNYAMTERDALKMRIDNALNELDQLADLLADSEDLPIGQTNAVATINDVIDVLAGW